MDERHASLLQAIVEEYIASAQPVGSQSLVSRYNLDVSPATVRNWCTELEAEGLLMQPHTSGGRVPTERGFQAYVTRFVVPKTCPKRERDLLERAFHAETDPERRLKALAKTLAELSELAVVAALGEADTYYTGLSHLFSQPEFRDWQRVVSLTEVLDRLDGALLQVRTVRLDDPRVLLGSDCPFGQAAGAVLLSVDSSMIGVLGPLRMDYQAVYRLMLGVRDVISLSRS
jgi:heat-inducible transcriptional repressor